MLKEKGCDRKVHPEAVKAIKYNYYNRLLEITSPKRQNKAIQAFRRAKVKRTPVIYRIDEEA